MERLFCSMDEIATKRRNWLAFVVGSMRWIELFSIFEDASLFFWLTGTSHEDLDTRKISRALME